MEVSKLLFHPRALDFEFELLKTFVSLQILSYEKRPSFSDSDSIIATTYRL